jgi:acetyl-CoA carboxylase carboxyl transferase subunit alpha
MLENSTYSVISPEGAAALLWKDAKLAERAAETMKITAQDLLNLGIVDEVVTEVFGGAHIDVSLQSSLLKPVLAQHMTELRGRTQNELLQGRAAKYHEIGTIGS